MSRSYPDSNDAKPGITALELALRAARSGQKTCLIQLQAGREPYAELVVEDNLLPYLNVFPALGVEMFGEENRASWRAYFAKEALELAGLALACGKYDLVILDEAPGAVAAGSVSGEDIRGLGNAANGARLIVIGMNADSTYDSIAGQPGRARKTAETINHAVAKATPL